MKKIKSHLPEILLLILFLVALLLLRIEPVNSVPSLNPENTIQHPSFYDNTITKRPTQ